MSSMISEIFFSYTVLGLLFELRGEVAAGRVCLDRQKRFICDKLPVHAPPTSEAAYCIKQHLVFPNPLAPTIHANTDTLRDEYLRKRLRCELAALVCIEYLRGPEVLKCLGAEQGVQRI